MLVGAIVGATGGGAGAVATGAAVGADFSTRSCAAGAAFDDPCKADHKEPLGWPDGAWAPYATPTAMAAAAAATRIPCRRGRKLGTSASSPATSKVVVRNVPPLVVATVVGGSAGSS